MKNIKKNQCSNLQCREEKDVLFHSYCYSCFVKYRYRWEDSGVVKMWFVEETTDKEWPVKIHDDWVPPNDGTLIIIDEECDDCTSLHWCTSCCLDELHKAIGQQGCVYITQEATCS